MIKKKYDITTIGDCVLDHFVKIDDAVIAVTGRRGLCLELPYGEKIPVSTFEFFPGGNALNTAAGFSRLGLRTAIYTHLGTGQDGEYLLKRIRSAGISEEYIQTRATTATDKSIILVARGERTVLSYHSQKPYQLPKNLKSAWVYLTSLGAGYEKLYRQAIAQRLRNTIALAFNPGTRQLRHSIENVRKVIAHTDVLCVNLEEAQKILNSASKAPGVLLAGLHDLGARVVAVTNGPRGAYGYDGQTMYQIRAFPAIRRDATGAGDSFASAFVAAHIYNQSLSQALRWASVNSASEIASVGVQNGLLTRTAILEKLKKATRYQASAKRLLTRPL